MRNHSWRRARKLAAVSVALFGIALPSAAWAQFDRNNPRSVGVALMPIEVGDPGAQGLAAILEQRLQQDLPRAVSQPIYLGNEVAPALRQGSLACASQPACISLMGGQFNVSLVANIRLDTNGSELLLEVDWYTTGNGLRIAREHLSYEIPDHQLLAPAFARWIDTLHPGSLRVTEQALSSEGGILNAGTAVEANQQRVDDYRRGREKTVSSRREDFATDEDQEFLFDRSDPTADLRHVVGDDGGGSEDRKNYRSQSGRSPSHSAAASKSRAKDETMDLDDPYGDDLPENGDSSSPDLYEDSLSSDNRDPYARDRRTRTGYKEGYSLDASQDTGRSLSTFADAQQMGLGKREFNRFVRSELTIEAYMDSRWAYGRRLHLRVGGFYGAGFLTRRYSTTVYITPTGSKTDEYMWEALGPSPANPGFSVGAGYAPIDVLQIELDFSLMLARQGLRREYTGVATNIPATPEYMTTMHVGGDLRLRFLLPPRSRVKFTPGLGLTALFMAPFSIPPEEPYNHTGRPPAAVIGITPLVGMTAALSNFLSLFIDITPTIYMTTGAATYAQHALAEGVDEAMLREGDKEPPYTECPATCPIMVRATVGTMIFF